jgi:RNA polymerase sigma-70 factor (ECF subfamily)
MRHNDAARVEAAYRATHERLWRSLFLWCGRADIASEAESEAFAQVCRCVADVRDIEAWVWRSAFRIARGLLTERPALDLGPEAAIASYSNAAGGVPDNRSSDLDLTDVVELADALARLSEVQRRCVVLRHVGGFSSSQIAELVDANPGAVRVHIHRGLQNLRRLMEPQP